MTIRAATFCLATALGLITGIWLSKPGPSLSDQVACHDAGGISLTSTTGAPLCIRRDALLNPHPNTKLPAANSPSHIRS